MKLVAAVVISAFFVIAHSEGNNCYSSLFKFLVHWVKKISF